MLKYGLGRLVTNQVFYQYLGRFCLISQLQICQNMILTFYTQLFFWGHHYILQYKICLCVEITKSTEVKSFFFSGQPLALKTLNRTERKFNRRSLCLWSLSFDCFIRLLATIVIFTCQIIIHIIKSGQIQEKAWTISI